VSFRGTAPAKNPSMPPTSRLARFSAMAGAVVWVVALFYRTGDSVETDLIQKVFLLAALVVVPLGISLIESKEEWITLRIAALLQPFTALLCLISLVLPQGIPAGILASAWLVTVSFIALAGLLRVVFSKQPLSLELAVSAGMMYLPVGGAWFVASRLGFQPLGFGDTIVLLTAVHFHFAGFAAPILVGLAGRQLAGSRALAVAAIAIVFGTPLVAAGITLSTKLALGGTLNVAFGLLLLGCVVLFRVVPKLQARLAQVLLVLASLSSCFAMVLAVLYSYSIVTKTVILDIPQMAMTHGLLNSFGFSLCGLLGWAIESPSTPPTIDLK